MRKLYIIANWKMQLEVKAAQELAKEMVRLWAGQGADQSNVSVILCPSFAALEEVGSEVKGTSIGLGAQDCFWETKGAYTGEVSPLALKEEGCQYCIVGHSERRKFLGETDEMVQKKVKALLGVGLIPIICVGETREEREAGQRDAVVINQLRAALDGNQPVGAQNVIIAYEPRWAIGTGQAVEPNDVASMHQLIYETLNELFPIDLVQRQFSVIYGGSADADNIGGLLQIPVIDGGLIGGAALKAEGFIKMAEVAADMSQD